MFETTSRLAEKAATGVSRRAFLGSLGRFAGAAALAVAGMLTTAGAVRARRKPSGGGSGGTVCCLGIYYDQFGYRHNCKFATTTTSCQLGKPFNCSTSTYPYCPR